MYTIQTATFNQVQLMVEWARQEGWNPGLDDANCFQLADPNGFFIGFLDGKPVASVSNVSYDGKFYFLGLYIVHPEFRGRGLGYQIWQHAIEYSNNVNCGLDGVIDEQANYMKSGFKLAYRNIRYILPESNLVTCNDYNLISASDLPLGLLIEYDQHFFPAPRNKWLMAWVLNHPTLIYYKDNVINGYGVIRRCHNGYKIGPLFANNYQIAEILLYGLCNLAEKQEPIFLDVPELNQDAIRLVESLNMQPVFETARMYSHKIPDIDLGKVFGVTTFELG